jgi:hypothetical protein
MSGCGERASWILKSEFGAKMLSDGYRTLSVKQEKNGNFLSIIFQKILNKLFVPNLHNTFTHQK